MRILDLCCGAGGMTRGFQKAGFEVWGIDIASQPSYCGDHFIQDDALKWLRDFGAHGFAGVHASVPCQPFTAYRRKGHGVGDGYPDLIDLMRTELELTGLPYVMENVPGAPLKDPVRLCGSSFGLDVRRHRLFETNWPLLVPPCDHSWQTPRFPAATNRAENSRCTVEVGVWRIPLDVQKRAMGVDWDVTLEELSEMVPPAFAAFIGQALLEHLGSRPHPAETLVPTQKTSVHWEVPGV